MLPEDIHLVQVHLEDPKDQERLLDNLEGPVAIHQDHQDHQDFQGAQAVLNQVGSLAFHRVKDPPVDTLVDDHQFHFRAVNQQEDQEQVPVVKVYRVDQVDDQRGFRQDQAVAILVADLVGKHQESFQVDKDLPNTQAVGPAKENQKVPDILAVGQVDKGQVEDIPADKLLEVIPVEHKSLVVREVDILVEGQELAILEVLKDLAVVQVLKDQADILEVLEVSKAQVEHLPAVILVLDQERKDQVATRVVQDRKGQAIIRVDQARKDQKDIQVDQERKDQEAIQADQVRKEEFQVNQLCKDQEDFQVDQEHKAQEDFQVDQEHKGQEDSQVDQERKGQEDFQVGLVRKGQEDSQALVIR